MNNSSLNNLPIGFADSFADTKLDENQLISAENAYKLALKTKHFAEVLKKEKEFSEFTTLLKSTAKFINKTVLSGQFSCEIELDNDKFIRKFASNELDTIYFKNLTYSSKFFDLLFKAYHFNDFAYTTLVNELIRNKYRCILYKKKEIFYLKIEW